MAFAGFEMDRRRFLLWTGITGAALVLPPLRRATATAVGPRSDTLFLSPDEYAVVRDATALIFPTDDTIGALDAGVADYIQRLLSLTPAGDANCDGRIGAADVIAENQAIAAGGSACAAADIDTDGSIDAVDLELVQREVF